MAEFPSPQNSKTQDVDENETLKEKSVLERQ